MSGCESWRTCSGELRVPYLESTAIRASPLAKQAETLPACSPRSPAFPWTNIAEFFCLDSPQQGCLHDPAAAAILPAWDTLGRTDPGRTGGKGRLPIHTCLLIHLPSIVRRSVRLPGTPVAGAIRRGLVRPVKHRSFLSHLPAGGVPRPACSYPGVWILCPLLPCHPSTPLPGPGELPSSAETAYLSCL